MSECKIINSRYIKSESITFQGDWRKAQKYKDKGYNVKDLGKGNGNWIANKPAQTLSLLEHGDKKEEVNLAYEIKDFYDKRNMTESLFEKFTNQVNEGEVGIYFSEDNGFIIK
ncbi:hypothetical protein [Clostridium beijerinckii]|uniref:hypothetical protein n=1 Tax=Clostridium beijerinckii TaxID=1520 RepID=UPI001F3E9CB3|nr:hypothetical protein [Clostridium beijerinckii]